MVFHKIGTETLRSCLLVCRFWCKVSVPILWKTIQSYNTLIACLPNESKEVLYKNEMIVTTLTSNPLLFNYVSFIEKFSIEEIKDNLKKHQLINFDNVKCMIMLQEVFKMFMNQTSLKSLNVHSWYWSDWPDSSCIQSIPFF